MSQSTRNEGSSWEPPKSRPDWEKIPLCEAVDALKGHLQTALLIELYTIPLYLFAAYSINTEEGGQGVKDAQKKIIGIVKQEMGHLGLAGNILCSIGGTPKLYGNKYIPKYPSEIFYDKVEMNLAPATKKTIGTFADAKAPPAPSDPRILIKDYGTIGEFYRSVEDGLKHMVERPQQVPLFIEATQHRQLEYDDLFIITNFKTAQTAIQCIITKGEGGIEGEGGSAAAEDSHYKIFQALPGMSLPCFPAMVACDAAYSYLLMSIQVLWNYDGDNDLRESIINKNIGGIMNSILKPIAKFLVTQPAGEDFPGQNVGAAYNIYDFGEDPLRELIGMAKAAAGAYPKDLNKIPNRVTELVDIKGFK